MGSKSEFKNINKITRGTKAINLAGKTSLYELFFLVKYSNLVICHDSSIMHIADTNNVPTIALLGPTDFSRTGPRNKNTYPVVSINESTMYMYNFLEDEDTTIKKFGEEYCMSNIKYESIISIIELLLKKEK